MLPCMARKKSDINKPSDINRIGKVLVETSRVPSHPFHELVSTKTPEAKRALEFWAAHDFFVSRSFPSLVALLISEMPDLEIRSTLVRNLWDECGHGRVELSHFRNYERLLASIGVVPAEPPCEAAIQFMEMQRHLARNNPFAAVGVFCYANEYLCLFEFKSISEGLKDFFPDVNLQYIMQIDSVDDRHQRELQEALASHCPPEHFDAIELHLRDTLEVRARLYDDAVAFATSA
jgi:pyrroloquinoline quinone (PQQ) biosynthesis protein C